MPALKMKSKSVTNSVRGYNLHSCHKATKRSKGSRSQVKTSQQAAAAVLDASEQNPHYGSSNIELSGQDDEITEANDFQDILAGFSSELLKFPPVLSDHIPAERMGSLSAPCSSNLETIFSPNFEHSDTQFELLDHNSEVRDEQCALPNLVAEESDDGSCTPSDFQSCDLVDLYLSENDSSLPFDGCMEFPDIISAVCPDYERINSDIMMDMAERYMILPFLEKTAETSDVCDEDSVEGAMNSDDSCLYLAIHQVKSSDQETETDQHIDDIEETESFDPQFVCRNLPDLSEAISSFCPIWWPKEARSRKPITLVLDLDETLVHSTLDHCDDADFTFPVFFNMKQHTVYVRRRPYLQIFLERVAQMFEIVIFTASQSIYAEQLLDILDPDRKLISQRIYRESCIFSDGNYTKDLTILGVDLAKVAIIDNSPQVFRLQVNNGIPIKSWFDDPSDHALISLLPFLETLVDADDVRPIIAKRYGNTE